MGAHCWQGRNDWLYDHDMNAYCEHVAAHYFDKGCLPDSTCLLPDGHDGPHEWTDDHDVKVTFQIEKAKPATIDERFPDSVHPAYRKPGVRL